MDFDKKIYKEYLEGNNEAFEILYNKYKDKIQYFIFNIIKDYEKAEDITQEVFIYIMKNKCREDVSFKYYIYLIAKSRAYSYFNVEKRREEITKQYLSKVDVENENDLLRIIIKQENKKELLEAINELGDKYKNAMYLTQIEELPYKQTAEILEENPQNIKNLVHRGKKELKKILALKGFKEISKLSKVLTIILCVGIILSGVVFAKNIKSFVKNFMVNIFGNTNEGVSTAIENNYNVEIDMDYVEVNNVKSKIEQIILDDFNLGIVSNFLINSEYNLEDVYKIEFKTLVIMNENNELLYAKYENTEEFYNFCDENNINKGDFGQGYSDGSYTGKILKNENNKLIFSFSTSSEKFPNSNKLYIKFDTIYLLNRTSEDITFDGIWEFEIDLEGIQEKRNTLEYSVVNINDNKTIVTRADLSMANMRLELITSSDKIDFKKLQNRDRNTMGVIEMIPFHEMYVETEDGKKFFQTTTGGNGYTTIEDGKINYYVTFNYTYFNKTQKIKIVLPTNKRKEIIIELECNNFEAQ